MTRFLGSEIALAPLSGAGSVATLVDLMAFTTREIESPDPATRVVAADAALHQSDDDIGEKMVLNMGPSHPATHGVLRLWTQTGGQNHYKTTPRLGLFPSEDTKNTQTMPNQQTGPCNQRCELIAPL